MPAGDNVTRVVSAAGCSRVEALLAANWPVTVKRSGNEVIVLDARIRQACGSYNHGKQLHHLQSGSGEAEGKNVLPRANRMVRRQRLNVVGIVQISVAFQ